MKHALQLIFLAFIANTYYNYCVGQPGKTATDLNIVMQQHQIVGASVAVVKDNQIIYHHSFGLKNIENNIPLDDSDIFRIASISKSFSATSIMQLVEAGKLSLQDDISKLIGFTVRNPKYPGQPITLKMILSHTSSINDSQGYFNLDVINPETNAEYAKCYNDYAPGQGYQYCNLNYNMTGAIIEKISGERFDNYVKRHVLSPLGLYAGYCVDSLDSNRFVTLYEYDNSAKKFIPQPEAYAPRREQISRYVMGYTTPVFSPTGGMKISATDLAKYMMMHMNLGKYHGVRILRKKAAKLMQQNVSEEAGYGLALLNTSNYIPGVSLTGHTGSAYGLFSAMLFNREKKFGIVVIINGCNTGNRDAENMAIKAVVNSLYHDLIQE